MKEYMELIKAHPAFEGITQEEDILWLRKCMEAEVVRFPKGETVFREGDEMIFASILLEGKALAVSSEGAVLPKGAGSFLFEQILSGSSFYAPYTLLADSDITVLSMRVLRLAKLCSFRCAFHGRLLDNIKKNFS
jgi:CRP-like cAMP-binding protein